MNDDSALLNALIFLGKFIGIDMAGFVRESHSDSKILQYFVENPGLVSFTIEDEIHLEGLETNFQDVHNRLVEEGAVPLTRSS